MNFFKNIRDYSRAISKIERTIYGEKQEYLEMYERNQQLEKEIETRTSELNIANKRMLSLQSIWEMINSSTPLENVLDKAVNSIHGELGYLHCEIMRKMNDKDGDYISIIAKSNDETIRAIDNIMEQSGEEFRFVYDNDSIYADTIKNKKIVQIRDIEGTLKSVLPNLPQEKIKNIMKSQKCKSMIVIPLFPLDKEFGWLCVYTDREELATAETDFLSLFSQQIEISITIADLFQAVKEQAVTDSLTQLYNRRYFEENLKKEVVRAKRQNQPFSIIGLDLDHLKKINDENGHAYGDMAIKTVANVLKTNARSIDIPARMGGEEFNILLPGVDSKGAMVAAERIRKAIEANELDVIGHITASIGVATYFEHTENVEELLELTDQAMYISKSQGRNRVTLATPVTETLWQEVAVNTFVEILEKRSFHIPQTVLENLNEILQNYKTTSEIDTIYNIADIINKTYNPMHENGIIKSKVLIASSLAKRFDMPKEEIDNLRIAMLLYDIGNLMLPQEIFRKSEPLTAQDRSVMEEHPVIAAQKILKPISCVQDIIPIIEHHHENWDGTGYPKKLSQEEIPLTSQIVLIVDEYFALTEARPYRPKMSKSDAINIIKNEAGKKWNKALVEEFITLTDIIE